VVQHIWEAIRCENTEKLEPVFDQDRPIRSTGDMGTWYTGKPCASTTRSHINVCVYDSAWEATEAFAPNMRGSLEVAAARMNEWTDATITVENDGKGLAKDVRVRLLGDAETEGLLDIPAVRAKSKESLKIRLKMTASGSVPLAIQIVSHRVFDGKEYTQEMLGQIDVSEVGADKAKRLVADLETRCPICKGLIKKGFKVTRCGCGRDFHELCASRVGRCPVCFRGLQGVGD